VKSLARPKHRGAPSARWNSRVTALSAIAAVVFLGVPALSGATFTSISHNTASTVSAAADWTPPTVTVNSPGTTVSGTAVTVTATASDVGSGVNNVVLQYLAPGASTWTTLCTATTSPYSCTWNTKLVTDGQYSLRGVATDNAGYTTTSDAVTTTVANNLLITLGDPGDFVAGTVPLTATIYNAGAVTYSVTIQYAPTGTTTWSTLCTIATSPYTCSWVTSGKSFTQGADYDLRAIATLAGTTTATSATIVDSQIDNVAPTSVAMTDPGSPLRGTVTLAGTATDADSGIATVLIQYQKSGTTTWTTACSFVIDPYSCRYDTTQLTDGTYSFRLVATDAAGNQTISSTIASRTVDNTVATVSMEDPGAYLTGTVTLLSTANSTAGIASVRIDRAPTGTTTWTTVCTVTTSPYSCAWNTTTVADGFYDFRAVMTDSLGRVTTSATMSNRRVDNSPLRGSDVQSISGGAIAGRLDAGDAVKLTYTEQINLTSIYAGWTGTSMAVTLRLRDGNAVSQGLGGSNDTVDFLKGSAVLPLGSVNLRGNYIKNNKTATFNATMVASTTTVAGKTATVITITAGTAITSTGLRTGAVATMVWTPSTTVTDLYGVACSAEPITELGAADREF
jgi:hypothetical protein